MSYPKYREDASQVRHSRGVNQAEAGALRGFSRSKLCSDQNLASRSGSGQATVTIWNILSSILCIRPGIDS